MKYGFFDLLGSFWTRIFDYRGVVSRKEFWLTQLYNFLIVCGLYGIGYGLDAAFVYPSSGPEYNLVLYFYILCTLYSYAQFIPDLAMIVRRLHDSGRTGPYVLFGFVPFLSLILLVWLCNRTQVEDNVWREDDISRGRPVLTPVTEAA